MSSNKHTVGSIIQKLKNYNVEQTVEYLLDQEEFTSFLCDILTSLPTEYKRAAQEMLRKTNQTKNRQRKSPALVIVMTHNFALPPSVQDHYRIWKENPSRFWQPFETSNANRITDEVDVIKANLQIWVAAGARYNKICEALDKGALFLIPQVPDEMWENPNFLKGADFDEVMTHLKNKGIMELSTQLDADFVANQILNAALEPFKWEVVDSRTVTANPSIESRTVPVDPYAGPRIIRADPDDPSPAITAIPSIATEALDTKPISISSLLNPPEAVQESGNTSRDIDLNLEPRNSSGKRQRIN
ncbi:hypothetical protein ACHAPC_003856 [Botrytis cinerea]|uniref:Uncharacterized protein n=1 Tax=Botryotinia fuckeliana (strain BcDW1) TaxID=1290391 RepID=M7TXT0_BOTF1|nr:hypothetical protein BcDW1_2819 [Botrytis cinerea BcDW1]